MVVVFFDLVVLVVTISVVVFVVTVSVCVVVFVVTKSVVGTSVVTRSVVVTLSVVVTSSTVVVVDGAGRLQMKLKTRVHSRSFHEPFCSDGFDVIAMQFCDFPEQCYLLR